MFIIYQTGATNRHNLACHVKILQIHLATAWIGEMCVEYFYMNLWNIQIAKKHKHLNTFHTAVRFSNVL